ncbi:MAG: ATP-binding protein [Planctomycetota bacterium]
MNLKKDQGNSKRSISKKLLAAFLVIGLMPLLIVSIISTLHILGALEKSVGANLQEIAAQTRDKTDMALEREIEGATRLGRTAVVLRQEVENANARYAGKSKPEILEEMKRIDKRWTQAPDDDDLVRQCLESEASSRLNSHMASNSQRFDEILLTDNQGALVGATGKTSDYYQADEEWWQEAFDRGKGAVYVSPLYCDADTNVVSLDIAAPVWDEKGECVIGVIKTALNARVLFSALTVTRTGKTGHAHLAASGGNILVDERGLLSGEKISADVVARLNPARPAWLVGSLHTGREQSPNSAIVGVAPVETMNRVSPGSFGGERWYILVAQDTDEAFAPVYHLAAILALIGGGVAIAIVVTGLWLGRRIARPIRALQEGAELIGGGQWNHRLDIKTGDEFEQLADEFDRMTARLAASHESLERQVKERTKELRCLHAVASLVQEPGSTLDDMFRKTVDLMPQSWQYPEITCARIIHKEKEFKARDFTETEWKQSSDITVSGGKVGAVEVFYTEERPELDEGPFLEEERELINAIAMEMRNAIVRKQAEEELRKAHARTEMLLFSISSILIATDVDGKITEWNAVAESTFNISRTDILGRPLTECHIQWDSDRILKSISDCISTRRLIRVDDVAFRQQDGEEGFLGITINPIKEKGKSAGTLLLGSNITERKNLEKQLLHSEKMASIGQLAAGIAHEINNPTGFVASNLNTLGEYTTDLAAVLKNCRCLIDACGGMEGAGGEAAGKAGELWEKYDVNSIMEDLDKVVKESVDGMGKIKKIVDDLKDFAHSGEKVVEVVDLNEIIDKALTIAWNEIKYKAEVVKEYAALPPVACWAGQLGQAFLNILVNAAQAIEDRGTIIIRTRTKGGNVCIEISDTGTGIPPEVLDRIYDPFFTTKPVGKGTGLGLNITYNIIKQHSGEITVHSKPGKGTTFKISLPVDGGPQLQNKADSEQLAAGVLES